MQLLFLSKVSMASKVTHFLLLDWVEWLSLLVIFMNGVEDSPVSCLSNFSLVSTLLAKINSISKIADINQGKVKLVWKGVFEIF